MISTYTSQRPGRGWMALLMALLLLPLAACGGPSSLSDNTAAAIVDGHVISMSTYLSTERVISGLIQINSQATANWQMPAGRSITQLAQSDTMNLLVTNVLLDEQLARLNIKYNQSQEDAGVKSIFTQNQSQYQFLIDDHVLTTQSVRPLIHQSVAQSQLLASPKVTILTTHARIMSVATLAKAQALRQQVLGGSDWVQLALKNSIDSASTVGGDLPVLPQGVLPAAIDQAIFGQVNPDPKAVTIVHTSLGYTLVQVLTAPKATPISQLDTQAPVLPNAQTSLQGAAITIYLQHLYQGTSSSLLVNWCGSISGQPCGAPSFNGL